MAQQVKNLPTMQDIQVQSLGREDTLEKGNGNPFQCSCLKKIPWAEEPGGLPSKGWQRVKHNEVCYKNIV